MKFNKWTVALAAIGAVSLASAARADEAKMSAVQTALSNTTISGYVSTSMNWQFSPSQGNIANSPAGSIPFQNGKANGFNLDVVKLSISKPEDDSEWAAGYQVDLLFGPDAVGYNASANSAGSADFGIQQAYVTLRTPVGNGIDWKVGVFNTVVGYEAMDAGSNPNYTRSWGWAVEPTENTGILGSYTVNDMLSLSAGVANTLTSGINARNNYSTGGNVNTDVWHKTVMGSATFTAPSNWGWAAGSAFYAGMVYGFANGATQASGGNQGGNQVNYYAGATLNSPWKDVTFGASFDYVQNLNGGVVNGPAAPFVNHANDYIFGLYNTIKATDKLSFNSRGEYWEIDGIANNEIGSDAGISLTESVEYDLWANVMTRLEFRYDHVMSGTWANAVGYYVPTGASVSDRTSYGLYANIIYKF